MLEHDFYRGAVNHLPKHSRKLPKFLRKITVQNVNNLCLQRSENIPTYESII